MTCWRIEQLKIVGPIGILLIFALCGCSRQVTSAVNAVEVKAVQVIQKDTPETYEFVGQVIAKKEAKISAKVSGNIIEKMVDGGAFVKVGQPLYRIDNRQYIAALSLAQAQLGKSQVAMRKANQDTMRYKQLVSTDAIARQVLDSSIAEEEEDMAAVDADRAKMRQAEADLEDTLITAPFDGRIEITDIGLGNYVQAGQTVLATLSSLDPVQVQFSISENDYLHITHQGDRDALMKVMRNLKIFLSDGGQYPLCGQIEQVDTGIGQNRGTIAVRAGFGNPERKLLPGMFARVEAQGDMRQGALLIPQRAIKEVMGKTFVTVIGEGNKAEQRVVTLGPRVGNMVVVERGLEAAEKVIIEGLAKAPPGTLLKVEMMNPDELTANS